MIITQDTLWQKEKKTILIVDDDKNFLFGLSHLLTKNNFNAIQSLRGEFALSLAQNHHPDLIISDINMPIMDGFQFKKFLDSNPETMYIPTLFLSAISDKEFTVNGLNLADDYLVKPVDPDLLIAKINAILRRVDCDKEKNISNKNFLTNDYDNFLKMGQSIEVHDAGTAGHTIRVSKWCSVFMKICGISGFELNAAVKGAMLHDIGKLTVPDHILNKAGPLNSDEWASMKYHPLAAVEMLHKITALSASLDIPHFHHERWDGKGYPEGLIGNSIPLVARIFTIVDVFDALRTKRPYKNEIDENTVLEMIKSESGKQFDPTLVDLFVLNFEKIKNEVENELAKKDINN
jgi:putative two-component system response regulator